MEKSIDIPRKWVYNIIVPRNLERNEVRTIAIYEINNPVAENIKKIIKEKGYKNNAVAERAGISAKDLSNLLNGRKVIKAKDIPILAKALHTTPNALYGLS